MRIIRTNSSKTTFEKNLVKFKQRLRTRVYPKTIIERSLSGFNFASKPSALTQKKKANERILPFVTTYHSAVSNLKQILMEQWSLTQNQSLLKIIFFKPPIVSYNRNIVNLFRTRLLNQKSNSRAVMEGDRQNYTSPCRPVTHLLSHPIMGSVTEVLPEI